MKRFLFVVLAVSALAALAGVAGATTYYVSTSGSDSYPGSSSQPWRTVQYAVNQIANGDTIIVRSGTYVGARITSSGASGAVKTLQSETVGGAILNSPSASAAHGGVLELENYDTPISYWVIDGFEVNGQSTYRAIDIRGEGATACASNNTVRNCHAHHAKSGTGVSTGIFDGFHAYGLYENNISHDNTEHGFYHSNSGGDYTTIRGNTSYNNAACGFHCNGDQSMGGSGVMHYCLWEKNTIYGNGATNGGSALNGDGVSDSKYFNNLLYNNSASGISLYAIDGIEASRNLIYNNTIVMPSNGRWCLNIPAGGSPNPQNNKVKNNILYNASSSKGSITTYSTSITGFESDYNVVIDRFSVNDDSSSITLATWRTYGWDTHSIISNPTALFVNPGSNDYHLLSNSPAKDAGTTLADIATDKDGNSRPQGSAYDIGCYEYVGSTPLTITTTGLPAGTVGTAYSQTLQASGGTTPYTWSLQSGSLPAGLSLGSSTGTISGTPTTAGTSNFTAKVTDNVGASATKALSIVINAPATLTITTTGLPNGVVGGAYSQTLTATGGVTPYTWSLQSGSLPGGLSLNASSGVISGTPTATGTSNFTAKVTDSQATPATATKALSIVVTTEPTYQFSASDSEASTTSTSYQTKATLTFTPGSVDDWVIFGFAEYKGSSTSYSALVKMQVDGADQAAITVEPAVATDYQSFATMKVANLSAASHTVTIQYASENTGATAYIRNARVVAVKKASLEMASNAADSAVALTTTLTNYVTTSFTPATAGDYLLVTSAEFNGATTSYSTEVQAKLGSTVLDDSLVEAKDTADYGAFFSASVVNCPASAQSLTVTAAKESGSSATHYIRRARAVAIRLSGSRLTGYQSAAADTESTTTSTAFQQKLTKSWSVTTAGDWLMLTSFRLANSSTSYNVEGLVQVDNTTTSAQPLRRPKDTTDYMNAGSVDVRSLTAASHFVDMDYRSSSASGTAKIKYAHAAALPLSGGGGVADLVITTTSVPAGQIGVAYSQTVSATGGVTPYTWSVLSGSLPGGLSLGSSTGTISGTPTTAGTSNFTVRVTDSQGTPDTDDQALSIVIPPDLTITTTGLAGGQVNVAYSQTLAASGGVTPYTWSLASGSLPAGLTLSSGGVISGTPTTAGTSNFTVRVTDSQSPADSATKALSIVIAPPVLTITTTSLPAGQIGVAYSQTVQAVGGTTPYTWTISSGSLPAGLSLGSSTGTISGTPTTAGTSNFTVRVTDNVSATDDQALSIAIPADLTVTTASLPNGTVGTAYSQSLAASGGVTPYSWSLASGSLPAGLTLSSGGVISGTPTAYGTSNFTARVTDSQTPADTATKALSIVVAPADLVITTTGLPNGSVGTAYSQTLTATGGVTPYTWSVYSGTLPAGLSLGSSTGTISGTPTTAGTSNFTIRVADSQGTPDTYDKALSIIVTGGGSFNVTFQDGVNGYTGTRDNWLNSDSPDTNNGTIDAAHLQYNTQDRQIHYFDISSIPSNATITSATISFYVYQVSSGTPNVNCYRILTQWDEMQSTYNSRLTGTAWGTPGLLSGTDYAATAIASSGNISAAGWANFTITSTVQAWVNGSQTNYGVMYKESTTGHLRTYMSEYATDTSLRPKLYVSYTTP